MNTMKKEDMQMEQAKIVQQIGISVANLLSPYCNLVSWVQRIQWLQAEIDKATPKPEIKKEEEVKSA